MTDPHATALALVASLGLPSLSDEVEAVRRIQEALEEAESAGMVGAWRKHNEGNCTVAAALRVDTVELVMEIEGSPEYEEWAQNKPAFEEPPTERVCTWVLMFLLKHAGLT